MHPNARAQLGNLFRPLLACPGLVGQQVRAQLFGLSGPQSTQEADSLSDSAMVVALLRTTLNSRNGLATLLKTSQLHIIGDVPEGPDTVHVLARITYRIDSLPISVVEVTSLQRYQETWRTMLKGDISSMAVFLRAACSGQGT